MYFCNINKDIIKKNLTKKNIINLNNDPIDNLLNTPTSSEKSIVLLKKILKGKYKQKGCSAFV